MDVKKKHYKSGFKSQKNDRNTILKSRKGLFCKYLFSEELIYLIQFNTIEKNLFV